MLTLMQTGLEAYAAPGILGILIVQVGTVVVAVVRSRRNGKNGNGKAPTAPAKCWLDDTNHEELFRGAVGAARQACEIISEKGSGGDKTPLVWRDTSIAGLVEKQTTELVNLRTVLLRMHDRTDMKELAEAIGRMCDKIDLMGSS